MPLVVEGEGPWHFGGRYSTILYLRLVIGTMKAPGQKRRLQRQRWLLLLLFVIAFAILSSSTSNLKIAGYYQNYLLPSSVINSTTITSSFFVNSTASLLERYKNYNVQRNEGNSSSPPPPTSSHSPAALTSWDVLEFEGSSNFLSLLRQAYQTKLSHPLPHCLQHYQHNNNTTNNQPQEQQLNDNNNIKKPTTIRSYNRAIEVDFIGRNGVSSVIPKWNSNDTASCQFVAKSFPPTSATLDIALRQRTYVSSFHVTKQCMDGGLYIWDDDLVRDGDFFLYCLFI